MSTTAKWVAGVVVLLVLFFFMKGSGSTPAPMSEPVATSTTQTVAGSTTTTTAQQPVVKKVPSVKAPVYTSVVKIIDINGPSKAAVGIQNSWIVNSTSPATEMTTYSVDWSDGSPAEIQESNVLTHIYNKPGLYVINFGVKNPHSKLVTEMKTVSVIAR